jgi:Restriction endonuclease S subunits
MKTYEKYKPSGVEWIGDIPEHWEVKKLKFTSEINSSTLPEKFKRDFEIKYIDISSVNSNGEITQTTDHWFSEAPSRARRIVQVGDTIISTVRTYLKAIAFIESEFENLICSTGFAVVRPNDCYFDKFLFYLCYSDFFIQRVVSLSKGVSYPAIDSEDIKNIFVWIPPLEEQTAIADYLDEKTAEIDELIAKKERLIELLKEERTAIINQAVTRGINPNVKLKPSGIDWLGDIPEHWEVKKLKFIADIFGGSTPSTSNEEFWDGEITWITPADVSKVKGNYIFDSQRKITKEGLKSCATKLLDEGTIILTTRAPIGNLVLAGVKFSTNQGCKSLVIKSGIPNFYFYQIGQLKEVLQAFGTGTTFKELSTDSLKNFLLNVPPIEEQKEIVEFIESKTNEIDSTIAKIEKEIELVKEYRTALISEVVTGKIKVC